MSTSKWVVTPTLENLLRYRDGLLRDYCATFGGLACPSQVVLVMGEDRLDQDACERSEPGQRGDQEDLERRQALRPRRRESGLTRHKPVRSIAQRGEEMHRRALSHAAPERNTDLGDVSAASLARLEVALAHDRLRQSLRRPATGTTPMRLDSLVGAPELHGQRPPLTTLGATALRP